MSPSKLCLERVFMFHPIWAFSATKLIQNLTKLNAGEFGLFFRCLPNKYFPLESEKWSGGKHSKTRITGLTGANAADEKLPLFVIRKAKDLRCFKYIQTLPCRYWSQNKSWMDSVLIENWVREENAGFKAKGRKIALLIDNCPVHTEIENLSHVKLIFLTPNTIESANRWIKASLVLWGLITENALSESFLLISIKTSLFLKSRYLKRCSCLSPHRMTSVTKQSSTAFENLTFPKKIKWTQWMILTIH